METALDVLSRAATMIQDNANESRLTSKELPTASWRRERRLRTVEYHHPNHCPSTGFSANSSRALSPSSSPPPNAHAQYSTISSEAVSNAASAHKISMIMNAATNIRPLSESTKQLTSNLASKIPFDKISHSQCLLSTNSIESEDAPLDMSVANLKQRSSPPPPYREPLPGSQYASSLARPSVITQAPPKQDTRDSILVTNRENDNRSCESIDEHFRRSLGNDYFSIFSKTGSAATYSPPSHNPPPPTAHVRYSSPTLPLSSGVQSELASPPDYPVKLLSANSQYAHQNQANTTFNTKNIILSPPTLASQTKMSASSPPLPLVVRSSVKQKELHTLVSQKFSPLKTNTLTSPQSPVISANNNFGNAMQASFFRASGSRTVSPIPLQQQPPSVTVSLSHLSSLDNSPLSSPCHTPPIHNFHVSNSSNLPSIMRIKTEPGLQNIKTKNPTPPASPTSTTTHISDSNSTTNTSYTSLPSSPKTSNWRASSNSGNTSSEVLASVDDHFAKALGDTWKKLQENKEIRK